MEVVPGAHLRQHELVVERCVAVKSAVGAVGGTSQLELIVEVHHPLTDTVPARVVGRGTGDRVGEHRLADLVAVPRRQRPDVVVADGPESLDVWDARYEHCDVRNLGLERGQGAVELAPERGYR